MTAQKYRCQNWTQIMLPLVYENTLDLIIPQSLSDQISKGHKIQVCETNYPVV